MLTLSINEHDFHLRIQLHALSFLYGLSLAFFLQFEFIEEIDVYRCENGEKEIALFTSLNRLQIYGTMSRDANMMKKMRAPSFQ